MSETTNTTNFENLESLKIDDNKFEEGSVTKLATRPNAPSRLGTSNLTAEALKQRFDKNPDLIRKSLNELIDSLINGEFAKDVKIDWGAEGSEEISTLSQFFAAILSGVLAAKYLKAKRNANVEAELLDTILSDFDKNKVNMSDVEDNAGKIARRDSNNQLIVPATPTDEQHATPKKYVDDELAKKVNKLDKSGVVYTNDGSGKPSGKLYSVELKADTIPLRDEDGVLQDVYTHNQSESAHPNIRNKALNSVKVTYDDKSSTLTFTSKTIDGTESSEEIDLLLESLKVIAVDVFIDEDDENKRKLKIAFAEGDPIIVEFDEIFNGIDKLLADKADKTDVETALKTKANKAEVEAELTKKATNEWVNTVCTLLSERIRALDISTTEDINRTNIRVNDVTKRVDNLEGMLIKHTIDSTEAYSKSVPTNSAHKAILNRVGGKTVKRGSKNICTDAVEGGIPFELDSFFVFRYTLPKGTYWIDVKVEGDEGFEYGTDYGKNDSFNVYDWTNPVTLDSEATYWCEVSGYTGVTGRIYPMIIEYTEGTEIPTEYEPYEAPSLVPTKVTEIVSVGKNRLPSDVFNVSSWEQYADAWWKYNLDLPDGWYCMTAKLKEGYKGDVYLYITKKNAEGKYSSEKAVYIGIGGTTNGYLITPNGIDTAPYWFKVDNKADVVYRLIFNYATQAKLDEIDYIQIESVNLQRAPSSVYMPMAYAPPTEYSPYRRNSYPIPEEIQSKEGYGYSVDGVCDEINFDSKKYVPRVVPLVLNGTEEWDVYNAAEYFTPWFALRINEATTSLYGSKFICAHYKQNDNIYYNSDNGIGWVEDTTNYFLGIRDSRFTSVDEFKAHLAELEENGTPLTLVCQLVNPTETDISHILTDYPDYKFIEVEGKGEIIAENTNKNPVPWTVTFAET